MGRLSIQRNTPCCINTWYIRAYHTSFVLLKASKCNALLLRSLASEIQKFVIKYVFVMIFVGVCCVGASYICKYSGNQSQWTNWNDWKERVSKGRQMRGFSLVSCYMIKPSHWLIHVNGVWTEVMVWWNVIATEYNIIALSIQNIQEKNIHLNSISVPDTKFKLTILALGRLSCQSFLMNNYSTEN